MPLWLREMQRQLIWREKIVANFRIAFEQNRYLFPPLCFQCRVLIDVNDINIKGLRGTALHFLQGRNHVVAKMTIASRQHRQSFHYYFESMRKVT